MSEYDGLAWRGKKMLAAMDRDLRYQFDYDLAKELVKAVSEMAGLSRLHEVATERTVQLAAVIAEAEFRTRDWLGSDFEDDMVALADRAEIQAAIEIVQGHILAALAAADTDAVLREVRAKAWDEGYLAGTADEVINGKWDGLTATIETANPYREGS